jgi:hypothetical protein
MAETPEKRRKTSSIDEIDQETGLPVKNPRGVEEDDYLPFGLENLLMPSPSTLGKKALGLLKVQGAKEIKRRTPVAESIDYKQAPKDRSAAIQLKREIGDTADPQKRAELLQKLKEVEQPSVKLPQKYVEKNGRGRIE